MRIKTKEILIEWQKDFISLENRGLLEKSGASLRSRLVDGSLKGDKFCMRQLAIHIKQEFEDEIGYMPGPTVQLIDAFARSINARMTIREEAHELYWLITNDLEPR